MTSFAARTTLLERTKPAEAPPSEGEEPARRDPRKVRINWSNILKIAAAFVILPALSIALYSWYQDVSTHEETDDASVQGHIHIISTRIAGTVGKVLVKDNQLVRAGDVLVELDRADYQVALEQANAALQVAQKQATAAGASIPQVVQTASAESTKAKGSLDESEAAIASARSLVAEAQSAIPSAKAHVAETEAVLAKARADYERYVVLEKQGAISTQQLDEAKASYLVAENSRKQAEQSVIQAEARLSQAEQAVSRAQAQKISSQGQIQHAAATQLQTDVTRRQFEASASGIAHAAANLKNAALQLAYTKITAPVSGEIGRKGVEVGQRVQPGQQLLAIVPNDFWVVANFKETQLERIHPGQKVSIKLDSFPHKEFTGKLESMSPASGAQFALLPPDNATGNFTKIVQRVPVKILFDPESFKGFESRVSPGMSAVVRVTVN
jgi:membrane fusion protein (multidrug efflux system)